MCHACECVCMCVYVNPENDAFAVSVPIRAVVFHELAPDNIKLEVGDGEVGGMFAPTSIFMGVDMNKKTYHCNYRIAHTYILMG